MPRTAVLTGDVVASTRLDPRATRELPKRLEEAGKLARELAHGISTGVDVFRGDAWQMALRPAEDALAVAMRFRIALRWLGEARGVDTRIAIGIGDVDRLPRDRVSRGNGSAFRSSGHRLDTMTRSRRLAIEIDTDPALTETLDTIVELIDTIMSEWTEAQAFAIDYALLGWTQTETAANWQPEPISQQAVQMHLKRAGWPAIQRAMTHVHEALRTRR